MNSEHEHRRLADVWECWQQYGVSVGINKARAEYVERFASCIYSSINHVAERRTQAKRAPKEQKWDAVVSLFAPSDAGEWQ